MTLRISMATAVVAIAVAAPAAHGQAGSPVPAAEAQLVAAYETVPAGGSAAPFDWTALALAAAGAAAALGAARVYRRFGVSLPLSGLLRARRRDRRFETREC